MKFRDRKMDIPPMERNDAVNHAERLVCISIAVVTVL